MRDYLNAANGDRFVRSFETRNQVPNNDVMQVDRASMLVNIEARVPYLDQRAIASHALSVSSAISLGVY